jgi:hypothetical protein
MLDGACATPQGRCNCHSVTKLWANADGHQEARGRTLKPATNPCAVVQCWSTLALTSAATSITCWLLLLLLGACVPFVL